MFPQPVENHQLTLYACFWTMAGSHSAPAGSNYRLNIAFWSAPSQSTEHSGAGIPVQGKIEPW